MLLFSLCRSHLQGDGGRAGLVPHLYVQRRPTHGHQVCPSGERKAMYTQKEAGKKRGRATGEGGRVYSISCIAVVVSPYVETLASLQCVDGEGRAFTDQAGMHSRSRREGEGGRGGDSKETRQEGDKNIPGTKYVYQVPGCSFLSVGSLP